MNKQNFAEAVANSVSATSIKLDYAALLALILDLIAAIRKCRENKLKDRAMAVKLVAAEMQRIRKHEHGRCPVAMRKIMKAKGVTDDATQDDLWHSAVAQAASIREAQLDFLVVR